MSGWFHVDTEALDEASARLAAVAGDLAEIDVAGPFAPVANALGGSRTGMACLWVSSRLGAALQVYAEHAESMAHRASETAESYRSADASVAGRLGTMVPR